MRMPYFGDSYDIVKRFLLHTIDPDGDWAALPILTEVVTPQEVAQFEAFLGVRVLRPRPVPVGDERQAYFAVRPEEHRILVDPNTGIRMGAPTKGKHSLDCAFSEELIGLCAAEPHRLIVVFDQRHPRGAQGESLKSKLDTFRQESVHGFAYTSHASLLVFSISEAALSGALSRRIASGLRGDRIVHPRPGTALGPVPADVEGRKP